MGFPAIRAKGFPSKRVDANLAGIIAVIFIKLASIVVIKYIIKKSCCNEWGAFNLQDFLKVTFF
jgi:hypothetical protein